MSIKQLAIRGVAFNWIGRVCSFAIAFVLTPILVHSLGDEGYGLWSIVVSLTSYYALADLGLRGAGVKYIAYYHAKSDWCSVSKVMATSIAIYGILALAVLLLALLTALVFPWCFAIGSEPAGNVRWVVFLTGLSVSLTMFGQVFSASVAALKRFDLANMGSVVAQLVQGGMMVLVLKMGGGLVAMSAVIVVVGLARQCSLFFFSRRLMPGVSFGPAFFDAGMLRPLFRFGLLNVLQTVAQSTAKSAGNLILGLILGPASVTFFDIAQRFVIKLETLGGSVTGVLMPVASSLDALDRRTSLVQGFLLATRSLLVLAVTLATVLICFGKPLIDFWIGAGYSGQAYPVLCLVATGMIFQMPSRCTRSVLTGLDQVHLVAQASVLEMTLTIVLGTALTALWGIRGMAYGILATQIIVAGFLLPWFAWTAMGVPFRLYLQQGIVPGLIAALPSTVLTVALAQWLAAVSLWDLAARTGVAILLSAMTAWFVCFDCGLRRDILRSFGLKLPVPRFLA